MASVFIRISLIRIASRCFTRGSIAFHRKDPVIKSPWSLTLLWLTAAAVKTAVAFGEAVVEKYLTKLSTSDHPVKSFDAFVRLVAIGLDQRNSAGHLLTELQAAGTQALRSEAGVAYVELMLKAAIETLRDSRASQRRYTELVHDSGKRSGSRAVLLGLDALRRGPAEILPTGRILASAALPLIVRSKPSAMSPWLRVFLRLLLTAHDA